MYDPHALATLAPAPAAALPGRRGPAFRVAEPVPADARRPRGVYRCPEAPAGTVVLCVYDRRGRRISRAELAADVYTPQTFDAFLAWLDAVDPEPVLRVC